jgi:primosomal protein N' (replication factor Y) (superfamily II helicase)
MIRYAEVALDIPFKEYETLTYEIPSSMTTLQVGCRVEVHLLKRKIEGVVLDIHLNMPRFKIEPILKQIDKTPIVNSEQISLARWMQEFYLSNLGEALYKMVPGGRRNKSSKFADIPVEKDLLSLNQEQSNAFSEIKKYFGTSSTHLIYGITGSGKTEIYIHLINEILEKTNQSAILLVPEISLTVQILKRLELIFGKQMALLHSSLKISEKFQNYTQLLRGEKRIAVGTRSAIFAPVKNLGLIILDEEHDGSYKEHSNPRYHARQVAMQRSKENKAVLVLGSATPSLEAYYHAKRGNIHLHRLSKRARSSSLSQVKVVRKKSDQEIISSDLLFGIKQRIEKGEQVVVLLNRRGYSPIVYNRLEKKFIECKNCSTNLCFHKTGKLICHICGHSEKWEALQRKIGKENLELMGSGTQKLEEYLLEKFPGAKIERLDQDATKNKGIVAEVITRLIHKEIDILTGTQMIAKGLDASHVTLVGVVNASIGLGLPDFRASERVFSLLTQVAGRAGRAELPGEVIIETDNTDHPVIQRAKTQDYEAFFNEEIIVRQHFFYPPFSRLIRMVTRSTNEEKSKSSIQIIYDILKKELGDKLEKDVYLLGPVECPFYKIESNYRNHLLLKSRDIADLKILIRLKVQTAKLPSGVYLEIDVDPVDLV